MPVFRVYTRSVPLAASAAQHTSHTRRWRPFVQRLALGGLVIAILATLLGRLGLSVVFFLLLPACVTLIVTLGTSRPYLYRRGRLLLVFCISLLYFSAVTGWELLTHGPKTQELIVVTTTLALAILFEPVRTFVQRFLEQRFNVQDDETTRLIEAFSSTLREEIELPRVRDGLLDVVWKTMRPQSITLWVRQTGPHTSNGPSPTSARENSDSQEMPPEGAVRADDLVQTEVVVADDDAIATYASQHAGPWDLDKLHVESPALIQLRTTAELALPLVSQGELIGLLALGRRLDGQSYSREDRTVLATLAIQVAPALRVAQLVEAQREQTRAQERIEQEMRTAREIQQAFLPKDVPALAGWRIAPYYQPARDVGGDFYDFIQFDDGQLGLVVGDVTGKGVPAALVMATVHTMLRTAALEVAAPHEVLSRVNNLLYDETPPEMFVTCFYAVLDPATGNLRYANAGHEPPFRLCGGTAAELMATGMPLGMMPDRRYDQLETMLMPKERLLFYSDGLVEAHDADGAMFGFPRLQAWLAEHTESPALVDMLVGELQRFTGVGQEPEDDVTLVMLQSLPVDARAATVRTQGDVQRG